MGAVRGQEMRIKRHLKLDLLKAVNPRVHLIESGNRFSFCSTHLLQYTISLAHLLVLSFRQVIFSIFVWKLSTSLVLCCTLYISIAWHRCNRGVVSLYGLERSKQQ